MSTPRRMSLRGRTSTQLSPQLLAELSAKLDVVSRELRQANELASPTARADAKPQLPVVCVSCASGNSEDSRYCSNCGQFLFRGPPRA